MRLAENIKMFREEKGMSQGELARKVYTSQQMIGAIEQGIRRPSLDLAIALAGIFETTVEVLVGRE